MESEDSSPPRFAFGPRELLEAQLLRGHSSSSMIGSTLNTSPGDPSWKSIVNDEAELSSH